MEGVTSFAVLHNGVCSQSECGLLPSLWRCVLFCPISYHKSIGGRSSSRWRAGRATSSRGRSTGRSRRVAAERGSLCTRRGSRKTVTCAGLRVVEPVYHQSLLRGRWRSRRGERQRAGLGEARFVISHDSHIYFVLLVIIINIPL